MAEPTLKEIESAHIDPEIATGEPAVVYDNTPLLQTLNQNAQLKQQNDWNRYRQFLSDYETRLKNGQDIADKDIADSDRDYLKKQTVELFSTALDNPTQIYSPEFNNKLAAIRTDAVSSKQARDYAEKNAQWMTIHPEFNTDENKAKITDYLENQTVENGGRKMFTLGIDDVFDAQKYFGGIRKLSSELAPASRVSPDNQFLIEQTNTRYKQKQFRDLVNAGYESTPKIQRVAKQQYDSLPENVKAQFKDPKEYWAEFGFKHFGTPNELDDKKQLTGNVLEYGKEDLKSNPNFDKLRHNKATEGIGWAKANAYVRKANAQLSKFKTEEEKAQQLEGYYVRNLVEQPTLIKGAGGTNVSFAPVEAKNSLPLFTFNNGKPSLLIPIGATYKSESKTWEGGHYEQEYVMNDRPLDTKTIENIYRGFKTNPDNKLKDIGFEEFLKKAIEKGKFKVKLRGKNGITDQQMTTAAQQAISNMNTKKNQTGVFNESDDGDPTFQSTEETESNSNS